MGCVICVACVSTDAVIVACVVAAECLPLPILIVI